MALLHTVGIITWEKPPASTDIAKYRLFWTDTKALPNYNSSFWDYVPANPNAPTVEVFFPLPGMSSISLNVRVGVAAVDTYGNMSDIVEVDISDDLLRGVDLVAPGAASRLTYEVAR